MHQKVQTHTSAFSKSLPFTESDCKRSQSSKLYLLGFLRCMSVLIGKKISCFLNITIQSCSLSCITSHCFTSFTFFYVISKFGAGIFSHFFVLFIEWWCCIVFVNKPVFSLTSTLLLFISLLGLGSFLLICVRTCRSLYGYVTAQEKVGVLKGFRCHLVRFKQFQRAVF